jgi:hypothetical protein
VGEKAAAAYGVATVSITDHDEDDWKILMLPGVTVTSHFRTLEEGAGGPSGVRAYLVPANGPGVILNRWLDGRTEGIAAGEYRIRVPLPRGYALADVLVNGRSVAGHSFTVSGGEDFEFVLTSRPGMVAGTLRDKNQAVLKGAEIVLIPLAADDPEQRRRQVSDANGGFVFSDLAPGKYRVEGGGEVEVRGGKTARVDVVR